MQGVDLINMNARLYDAKLHRLLAPDNFVQEPDNSQNYNCYAYAFNNPLRYTDPSGNIAIVDDIVAAAIGAFINLGVNIYQGNIKGDFWEVIGKGAAAFGAGAVSGYGMVNPQYGGWLWGGAVLGSTNAWLSGGDIAQGAAIGALTSVVGGAVGQGLSPTFTMAIQGLKISSPALNGAVAGALSGSMIGGSFSGVIAFVQTGSFSQAIDAFGSGAAMGLVTGIISGTVSAYHSANKQGYNGLTGELKNPQGSQKSNNTLKPIPKLNKQIENIQRDYQKQLTNEQLLSEVAKRAEKNIGGEGRFAGSAKHSYASRFLKHYQNLYGNRGLEVNFYFKDVGFGKGFLDVLDTKNNVIYDFKFGNPTMSNAQYNKYHNTFNLPIKIISREGIITNR